MASNRSAYIANMVTMLTGVTGAASAFAGQDWPETQQHESSELPMLWVKTPDQDVEVNPGQYRLDDLVQVRIYRLDWDTKATFANAELWIEKVVEAIEAEPTLGGCVAFSEYNASRAVVRDFPLCIEEVDFKVVHHRSFTDI